MSGVSSPGSVAAIRGQRGQRSSRSQRRQARVPRHEAFNEISSSTVAFVTFYAALERISADWCSSRLLAGGGSASASGTSMCTPTPHSVPLQAPSSNSEEGV